MSYPYAENFELIKFESINVLGGKDLEFKYHGLGLNDVLVKDDAKYSKVITNFRKEKKSRPSEFRRATVKASMNFLKKYSNFGDLNVRTACNYILNNLNSDDDWDKQFALDAIATWLLVSGNIEMPRFFSAHKNWLGDGVSEGEMLTLSNYILEETRGEGTDLKAIRAQTVMSAVEKWNEVPKNSKILLNMSHFANR